MSVAWNQMRFRIICIIIRFNDSIVRPESEPIIAVLLANILKSVVKWHLMALYL